MKTTILLLVLGCVFLSGCSTNYTYPSKNISVLKKSQAYKEYELLSVRGDSAIVVLDWKERNSDPLPFSHAEVLKKDSIAFIYRENRGTSQTLVGTGVGLGIGVLMSISILTSPDYSAFSGVLTLAVITVTTLVGLIVGVVFDGFSYMDLSLASAKDRGFLHSISRYPDKEPPEMLYLK